MPPSLLYAVVMFAAGIGIPILAALNADLGARIAAPAVAALCLFVVAALATLAVLAVTGPGRIATLAEQPRHLFTAGLFVAFYVLSVTWIAPRFGVGNAIFFVLLGQIAAAAVIDHFGLMNARPVPMDTRRALGIALMIAGVALARKV